MASQGIDIFNPEDPFFNDICYPYTTNSSTDIPLKDRRKDIFQNVSLCDTDCTYKGFDTITYEVTCDCSIKTELSFDSTEPSIPFYTSLIESTNIMIVKCYKLLGIKSNYIYNIGFWLYLVGFLIILISICYYYIFAKKAFYCLLLNNTKSSPIRLNEKSLSISSSERTAIFEKEVFNQKEEEEESDIDIDKAPFNIALEKDNRIWCKMIYDNCVSKLDLISITIFPGKFDIISISISLYILSIRSME